MFGLIFFPDRDKGFRELLRVLAPGGRAVVGSWVPVARVPVMAGVFRTLAELLPSLPFGGKATPLGEASEFRAEMTSAGFRDVEVHEVIHALQVQSIMEYWEMQESTPPIHAVREAVGLERWSTVRQELVESLEAKFGTGPQCIQMIANLGVGLA
jgi:SAM-dependent methyltransferase